MGRKVQQRSTKPRFAIVGDGETEKIYFSDVKDTDRPDDFDLFPSLPAKKGDYAKVLNSAIALAEEYMRAFALIDKDALINDGKEKEYQAARQAAETKGVVVLEVGPCFEFWLLLHFVATSRSFTRCDEVVEALRKPGRIPGYEKSQKFLVKARLYANYKDRIPFAIRSAKKLRMDRPEGNPYYPRADIYEFFEWYCHPERLNLLQEGKIWPRG
jgi:hypothetical protein